MELYTEKNVLKKELEYEGTVLLTYRIAYPVFQGSKYQMALAVVNKYYEQKAQAYQTYLETELFAQAVEQYKELTEKSLPVHPYEAIMDFKQTYAKACVLSLYVDKYEYTGGAHGSTMRSSLTWNLQRCGKINLEELFRCDLDYRAYIFLQVKKQIKKNPSIYFDNYESLLVDNFNPRNFFCMPHGIVIYYQQYDIAPYSSGIREFPIPYTECVRNPAVTCFPV